MCASSSALMKRSLSRPALSSALDASSHSARCRSRSNSTLISALSALFDRSASLSSRSSRSMRAALACNVASLSLLRFCRVVDDRSSEESAVIGAVTVLCSLFADSSSSRSMASFSLRRRCASERRCSSVVGEGGDGGETGCEKGMEAKLSLGRRGSRCGAG